MKPFALGRRQSLKSQKAIEALARGGASLVGYPMRVVYAARPGAGEPLQVCFSVPKRKLRHAVDRNLVKRRMREAWRHRVPELRAQLAAAGLQAQALLIYTQATIESYAQIDRGVAKIARALASKVAGGDIAPPRDPASAVQPGEGAQNKPGAAALQHTAPADN